MSEHTLSLRHLNKCGREGCNCLVDPGDSYCGEACEHADSKAEKSHQNHAAACDCAHSDCKQLGSVADMNGHGLSPRHLDKCGRKGCNCLVDPGDSYCSDQCEHADSKAEKDNRQNHADACTCAHADCKQLESAEKVKGRDSTHAGATVTTKRHRHAANRPGALTLRAASNAADRK